MASLPVGQQGSGVHGGTRVGALWHRTYEPSPTTPLAQWQESEWQGSGKRGVLGAMRQDEDFSVGLYLVHLCVALFLLLLRVTLFLFVLRVALFLLVVCVTLVVSFLHATLCVILLCGGRGALGVMSNES